MNEKDSPDEVKVPLSQGFSGIAAGALEGSYDRLRRRKRLCALSQTIVRVGANHTRAFCEGGG